jgi:hypothetical protein
VHAVQAQAMVLRGGVRNEAEKKSGDEMKAASAQ